MYGLYYSYLGIPINHCYKDPYQTTRIQWNVAESFFVAHLLRPRQDRHQELKEEKEVTGEHFLVGGNSNIFYFHPYLGK